MSIGPIASVNNQGPGLSSSIKQRSQMSIAETFALLCGLVLAAVACGTITPTVWDTVWEQRTAPTSLAPGNAVVVVLQDFSGVFSRTKEDEFAGCLRDAILGAYPTVRIVQPEQFRSAIRAADSGQRSWEELAKDARFKERVASFGLRYLISVSGETRDNSIDFRHPRSTSLKASIFDLKQGHRAGDLYASTQAVTIWLRPFTESRACKELGEAVAQFLGGEGP